MARNHTTQGGSAAEALADYLAIEKRAFEVFAAAKRAAWEDYLKIHNPAFTAYQEAVTRTMRTKRRAS